MYVIMNMYHSYEIMSLVINTYSILPVEISMNEPGGDDHDFTIHFHYAVQCSVFTFAAHVLFVALLSI